MGLFHHLIFLIACITICNQAKVVFLDNFNSNPVSFFNTNASKWSIAFGAQRADFLSNKGSNVVLETRIGESNFLPNGALSLLNFAPFASTINSPTSFEVSDNQILSATFTAQVETKSNSNPLAGILADDDIRRGNTFFILGDNDFGQTICFVVSGTEIWIAQDSLGFFFGLPYQNWVSLKKVADKLPEDIIDYTVEYDAAINEMSWYVNGVLVFNHIAGTPGGDVVRTLLTGIQPPLPITRLKSFGVFMDHLVILDGQFPSETKGPVNFFGASFPHTFPTDFHHDSYDCFDSANNPVGVDVAGFCPLLDGYEIKTTVHKVKVELRKA